MEAPNLCSFALVAGKYLDHLDEVLRKVDELAESTDNIPIAVYLFREYNNQELKINNSLRLDTLKHYLFVFQFWRGY